MVTMTELFKIVAANDYNTLEKLIINNKRPNFNCIKSGISLITKSIEVRAYECFNLLLTINELTILQSNNRNINGLGIALEYYTLAPNPSNKYYLDKLIDKNIYIDTISVSKCINEPVLFELMFHQLIKTGDALRYLIEHAIIINNMYYMNKIYEYLFEENPLYYDTIEKKQFFNNEILKMAILLNNINAIEYLVNIGHNILTVTIQNNTIPSLYYAYTQTIGYYAFNIIFSHMKDLDIETLNNIPQINKLSLTQKENHYNFDNMRKILSLPIEWTDIHDVIANNFTICYRYGNRLYIEKQRLNKIKDYQYLMFLILKTNKINGNPYHKIGTYNYDMERIVTNVATSNIIKEAIGKNKYILNYFNIIEPEKMSQHFKLLFTDNICHETEKKKYIEELEYWYVNGVTEKKITTKKSQKKKTQSIEINV